MSTVIKGGTIVTADVVHEADVRIEGETIAEIGRSLKGDKVLDAAGCYVMPAGIDPHVHLEMPFMGTTSADDFYSGTRAAISGGTTMVVDFVLPAPGESLLAARALPGRPSGLLLLEGAYHASGHRALARKHADRGVRSEQADAYQSVIPRLDRGTQ